MEELQCWAAASSCTMLLIFQVCTVDGLERVMMLGFHSPLHSPVRSSHSLESLDSAVYCSLGPSRSPPRPLSSQDLAARDAAIHGSFTSLPGGTARVAPIGEGATSVRALSLGKDIPISVPGQGPVRTPSFLELQALSPRSQVSSVPEIDVMGKGTVQGSNMQIGNRQYTAFSNPVREET